MAARRGALPCGSRPAPRDADVAPRLDLESPLRRVLCRASKAAKKLKKAKKVSSEGAGGCLSVWALATLTFSGSGIVPGTSTSDGVFKVLEQVTVPTATNANLRSQEGLFVHVREDSDFLKIGGDVYREGLEALIAKEPFRSMGRTLLYQLNLPVPEAPELLRLVGWFGASAGRFNPTLRGVVEELEESGLVDRKGRVQDRNGA